MARAAMVVVPFMTPQYQRSRNCQSELKYAYDRNKRIIPAKVRAGYVADDWLGLVTAGKKWFALDGDLEKAIDNLAAEIKAKKS